MKNEKLKRKMKNEKEKRKERVKERTRSNSAIVLVDAEATKGRTGRAAAGPEAGEAGEYTAVHGAIFFTRSKALAVLRCDEWRAERAREAPKIKRYFPQIVRINEQIPDSRTRFPANALIIVDLPALGSPAKPTVSIAILFFRGPFRVVSLFLF